MFLSCECGGLNLRKIIPQFPIKVEFNDPSEHWVVTATKDGHEDLYLPVSFEDGVADKELTVTLRVRPMTP